MRTYAEEIEIAENIVSEARFAVDYGETSDVKLYYDLLDDIDKLNLSIEDKELYKIRIDSILGSNLK